MQISILLCPLLRVECPLIEKYSLQKVQSYGYALKYSSVCLISTFLTAVAKQYKC
jgi:hypothetical protein